MLIRNALHIYIHYKSTLDNFLLILQASNLGQLKNQQTIPANFQHFEIQSSPFHRQPCKLVFSDWRNSKISVKIHVLLPNKNESK